MTPNIDQSQDWFDMLPALPELDNVKAINFEIFNIIVKYAYHSGVKAGLLEAKQLLKNITSESVSL